MPRSEKGRKYLMNALEMILRSVFLTSGMVIFGLLIGTSSKVIILFSLLFFLVSLIFLHISEARRVRILYNQAFGLFISVIVFVAVWIFGTFLIAAKVSICLALISSVGKIFFVLSKNLESIRRMLAYFRDALF